MAKETRYMYTTDFGKWNQLMEALDLPTERDYGVVSNQPWFPIITVKVHIFRSGSLNAYQLAGHDWVGYRRTKPLLLEGPLSPEQIQTILAHGFELELPR